MRTDYDRFDRVGRSRACYVITDQCRAFIALVGNYILTSAKENVVVVFICLIDRSKKTH
jgi:hypothetical protein